MVHTIPQDPCWDTVEQIAKKAEKACDTPYLEREAADACMQRCVVPWRNLPWQTSLAIALAGL